jgi:DNA-binding MarR family transcriptional regulator
MVKRDLLVIFLSMLLMLQAATAQLVEGNGSEDAPPPSLHGTLVVRVIDNSTGQCIANADVKVTEAADGRLLGTRNAKTAVDGNAVFDLAYGQKQIEVWNVTNYRTPDTYYRSVELNSPEQEFVFPLSWMHIDNAPNFSIVGNCLDASSATPPKPAVCDSTLPAGNKISFVEGLLNPNGFSISNLSGNGLSTEVSGVRYENCSGREVSTVFFAQQYKGIPILMYEAKAHFLNGKMQGLCYLVVPQGIAKSQCDSARYFDFALLGTTPAIAEGNARLTAIGSASEWGGYFDAAGMDSVLAYWYDYQNGRMRLAWVFGQKGNYQGERYRPIDARVVIDATDGSVLFSDSGFRSGTGAVPQVETPARAPQPAQETGDVGSEKLGVPAFGMADKSAADAASGQKKDEFPLAIIAPVIAVFAIALALIAVLMFRAPAAEQVESTRMLMNETRLGILNELVQSEKIPTDLSRRLKRSKATIVEHLDKLIDAGLVERMEEPGKKFVFYRLTQKGRGLLYKQAG